MNIEIGLSRCTFLFCLGMFTYVSVTIAGALAVDGGGRNAKEDDGQELAANHVSKAVQFLYRIGRNKTKTRLRDLLVLMDTVYGKIHFFLKILYHK